MNVFMGFFYICYVGGKRTRVLGRPKKLIDFSEHILLFQAIKFKMNDFQKNIRRRKDVGN